MVCEQVFTVSPEQLLKLACAQLQADKGLPDGEWNVSLKIKTDGKSAKVTSAVLRFREAVPPMSG